MSVSRYLAIVAVPGDLADLGEAMDLAKTIYGPDVLLVQTADSWTLTCEKAKAWERIRDRNLHRRNNDSEDDGA